MRKTFYFLAFLMLLPMSWGQVSNPSIIVVASAPSGACNVNLPDRQVTAAGTVYTCQSGTWGQLASGGGGSLPTATAAGQIITSSAAGTTYVAQGQIFYQQSGDTIASIETQCSSLCTYVVTEPQTITLSGDHAMSSNVWVRFEGDGAWNVTGAHTLSNVQVASGTTLTQHFSLASSAVVILSVLNTQNPVLWFGAKCDGSTNDLTAIQNTINATTYGQAVLPAAVCDIAGTLTVNKNSVGIRGAPAGRGGGQASLGAFVSSLVETVAGDSAITETGVSGTPIVYNIYQDFNILSSVTQTGTAAGLSLSFTGGVKVENLFSQDFFYPYYIHASPSYGNGGFFQDVAQWTSLSSGLSTPIGFYLDSSDGYAEDSLTIRDSAVAQGGGPNSCIGMMLYGTAVNDVNTFNFNIAGCNDGQDVDYTGTGANGSASDDHFISTTVDTYHQHGMFFTATSAADAQAAGSSITVIDPRIAGAATDGINITNTSGVIVSSGQFRSVGIVAATATQLTLVGNEIQNAAEPIQLTDSNYSAISSNTITNDSGSAGVYGILLTGTSNNNNVTSNNVTGYFNNWDIFTGTSTSNNILVGNQVDPTNATLGAIGLNGTGNISFNSNPNGFRSSIDTTGDTTYPAYRGIGPVNFSGWKDGTPTGAWSLGYSVPSNTIGNDPVFSYYDGSAWHEAWDVNSANGVLDAINGIATPSVNQTAASSTGGTCSMSTSTSCTITLGHTYTTPVCIITQQSVTLTGGAGGCTVSGTTVTITAAVANSETWGAFVFGNPN